MTNNFQSPRQSLFCDGGTTYLSLSDPGNGVANYEPNADEAFSIAFWGIQQANHSTGWAASKLDGNDGWLFGFYNGMLNFAWYNQGTDLGANSFKSDHSCDAYYGNAPGLYVVTFSGNSNQSGLTLYANGCLEKIGSSVAIGATNSSTADVQIGKGQRIFEID